jgi:hypothetical protein
MRSQFSSPPTPRWQGLLNWLALLALLALGLVV